MITDANSLTQFRVQSIKLILIYFRIVYKRALKCFYLSLQYYLVFTEI